MTFVTNRWVRGEDFFGRDALLDTILNGTRDTLWVLGNRRVGKTSSLRQIEWLVKDKPDILCLFWDLQGAGSVDGLMDSLLEAFDDQPTVAEALDLDIDALENGNFVDAIRKIRRKVKNLKSQRLLLLMDEIEEVVDISQEDPSVLSSMRKLFHSSQSLRTVVAGSLRFLELDESSAKTSPLLPDFLPSLPLYPLDEKEATAMLARGGIQAEDAQTIHAQTLGNPHLMAALGERFLATKDLDQAIEELQLHKVLHYFFDSNFNCLPEPMRQWFKAEEAIAQLLALDSSDPHFEYAKQASLLTERDGQIILSPLLQRICKGQTQSTAPSSKSAPKHTQAADHNAKADNILAKTLTYLDSLKQEAACPTLLLVRPNQDNPLPKPPRLQDALKTASQEQLHHILDGASPEYIKDTSAAASTAIYLTGLYLYHGLYGHGLFRDVSDPISRATAILTLDPNLSQHDFDRRINMVLARALKPNPAFRYQDLHTLRQDLAAIQSP